MKKAIISGFIVLLLLAPTKALAVDLAMYGEDGRAVLTDTPAELLSLEDGLPYYFSDAGYVMLPVRLVAEHYGARVDWVGNEVVILLADIQYTVEIGSNIVLIKAGGGETSKTMQHAAFTKNSRVFVPLQFFTEIIGKDIKYGGLEFSAPDRPGALINAVLLDKLLYDDFTPFMLNCLTYDRPGITAGKVAEMMLAYDEEYQQSNYYGCDEIYNIVNTYMSDPIRDVVNFTLYADIDAYFESQYETAGSQKARIAETYAAHFSGEVTGSQGWKDFLCLAEVANDIYIEGCITSSTENAISGTFFCNLNSKISTLPLLLEAELTRQVDGSWLITEIVNPRAYINMQSLAAAEPEAFAQLELELYYRNYWTQNIPDDNLIG